MAEDLKTESLVNEILSNDITKLFLFIGAIMSFVNFLVLPLQKVQIQLAQIQADIAEQKLEYEAVIKQTNDLEGRVDVIDTEIKPLICKGCGQ